MKCRESFAGVGRVNSNGEALNLKKSAKAARIWSLRGPFSKSQEVIRDGEFGLGQGSVLERWRIFLNFLTMKMKIIPQSDVVQSDDGEDDVSKERRGEKAKVVLTVKSLQMLSENCFKQNWKMHLHHYHHHRHHHLSHYRHHCQNHHHHCHLFQQDESFKKVQFQFWRVGKSWLTWQRCIYHIFLASSPLSLSSLSLLTSLSSLASLSS